MIVQKIMTLKLTQFSNVLGDLIQKNAFTPLIYSLVFLLMQIFLIIYNVSFYYFEVFVLYSVLCVT
jgi:hypothetical protein